MAKKLAVEASKSEQHPPLLCLREEAVEDEDNEEEEDERLKEKKHGLNNWLLTFRGVVDNSACEVSSPSSLSVCCIVLIGLPLGF